jgi:hypothetical protein
MNLAEARVVITMVKALRPGQRFPDNDPNATATDVKTVTTAWHMLLGKIDLQDAIEAVGKLAENEAVRYIEPQHILGEVRRVRTRRVELGAHRAPAPPAIDAGGRDLSPEAFMRELRRRTAAIANGQAPQWPRAIEPGKEPEYVGKPTQWADGDAPVEHRAELAEARDVMAAVQARRAPEVPRALPTPLPAEEAAAYDAARRVLGTFEDLGEAYLEQARQKAKPGDTHVQIMIEAAKIAQPQTRAS